MSGQDLSALHELIHLKLKELVHNNSTNTLSLFALSRIETCGLTTQLQKLESKISALNTLDKRKFSNITLNHTLLHVIQKEILNQFTKGNYSLAKEIFFEDYNKRSEEFINLLKECENLLT